MSKSAYRYYPTGAVEKSLINSIWLLKDSNPFGEKEIILPKGTAEIIFNFSDRVAYVNPSLKISKILPPVFINGINFKPFELAKRGKQEFLGIQLSSMGLRLLFNMPASEFNDSVYDAPDICPCLKDLAGELVQIPSFYGQVEIIIKWIQKRIAALHDRYLMNRVMQLQSLSISEKITVKKLSAEFCLSDRQLRRISHDWLGMNTEEFIHYSKYLRSLNLLHHANLSLTEIGLESGYYDQSHFIREFKSYTGLTPSQYRNMNKGIPGHIYL